MTEKSDRLEIKEFLSFPFRDPQWVQKLLIAGIMLAIWFIPILPALILSGYLAQLMIGIIGDGREPFLPEWKDFNRLFSDGLQVLGVFFVYFLPIALMLLVGYLAFFLPVLATETFHAGGGLEVLAIISGYLFGFGLMGLGSLLAFGVGLFAPLAVCHVLAEERFGAAFQWGELYRILKANWDGFLVTYLLIIGGSVTAYYGSQFLLLTVVCCCLYPFLWAGIGAYFSVSGSALFAQQYREARDSLSSLDES